MNINDLVFAGLNGRVVALDRARGRIVWQWRSPKPTRGFVTLMLDGDRLLAGLGGYLYCLDPATGRLLWENPLTGFGLGIFSFASVRGSTHPAGAAQQAADDESSDAAAAGSAVG
jgi:PQQ-like domain